MEYQSLLSVFGTDGSLIDPGKEKLFTAGDPVYRPDFFNESSRYNILNISDAHLYGDKNTRESGRELAEDITPYIEQYDINLICDKGDSGGTAAVEGFLDEISELDIEVVMIPGDEDRKDQGYYSERDKIEDMYDIVRIEEGGFQTNIKGHNIAFAHHPRRTDEDAMQDFFTVNFWDNEEYYMEHDIGPFYLLESDSDIRQPLGYPSKDENVFDMVSHAHSHTEFPRQIFYTVVNSGGALQGNYQMEPHADADIPGSSIQVNSFDEDNIDILSFDFDEDELFQHLRFERDMANTLLTQAAQKLVEGEDIGVERVDQDLLEEQGVPHNEEMITEPEWKVLMKEEGLTMQDRIEAAIQEENESAASD